MFYFHEILKKKGKFGVIWLAATDPKRLRRRDAYSVDVVRSSEDIIEVLTRYPSMAGKLNNLKATILLEDLQTLASRICKFRREPSSVIDLQEPVSRHRVTMEEPDFDNIDFGAFLITDDASVSLPRYDYFIVSTPQSSEESLRDISLQLPEQPQAGIIDESAREVQDEITARPEDITMLEKPLLHTTEDLFAQEIMEGIAGADFLEPHPLLEDSVPEPIVEREVSEKEPAEPEMLPEARMEETIPMEAADEEQLVPAPPEPELDVEQPVIAEQLGAQDLRTPEDTTLFQEPAESSRDDERKKEKELREKKKSPECDESVIEQRDSEVPFVLEPPPTTPKRRRRRRHLIIDTETTIPLYEMKRNLCTANERFVRPLTLPSLTETATSMLSRFGLRAAARGNKRFWPNPRTLPEPTDLSRFGLFGDISVEDSSRVLVEETVIPDITTGSTEERRAEDTHGSREITQVDLSGRPSQASRISRLFQESGEQISSTGVSRISSFQRPDISTPEMPGVATDLDEFADILVEPYLKETAAEPQIATAVPKRVSKFQDEAEMPSGQEAEQQRRKESTTCVVSPERTPPPPSPPIPTSPLIDRAMTYIREALNESPEPNMTCFSSVLSKTPMTKMYVAKMFNLLLTLHESCVIYVQQAVPGGEIFISRGPNFDAFLAASSSS